MSGTVDIEKLKADYTQAILAYKPIVAENNQNKLNRIDYKPTYSPSTYQTTYDFSHNNNNNIML